MLRLLFLRVSNHKWIPILSTHSLQQVGSLATVPKGHARWIPKVTLRESPFPPWCQTIWSSKHRRSWILKSSAVASSSARGVMRVLRVKVDKAMLKPFRVCQNKVSPSFLVTMKWAWLIKASWHHSLASWSKVPSPWDLQGIQLWRAQVSPPWKAQGCASQTTTLIVWCQKQRSLCLKSLISVPFLKPKKLMKTLTTDIKSSLIPRLNHLAKIVTRKAEISQFAARVDLLALLRILKVTIMIEFSLNHVRPRATMMKVRISKMAKFKAKLVMLSSL